MQNTFKGPNVSSAIQKATGREPQTEAKSHQVQLLAPPLFWGKAHTILTRFGVVGPNSENHKSRIEIHFSTKSQTESTFDVEITGGDRTVRGIGPGPVTTTLTGNTATEIKVRCRSHSITGLNVIARTDFS